MTANRAQETPAKILYVVGELTGGGYQRQLQLLLSRVETDVIQSALAVWRYADTQPMVPLFRTLGVSIFPVRRNGSRLQRVKDLCRIACEVRPDYLHSFCFYTNFPTWMAGMVCRAKGTLGSFRSNYWDEIATAGPLLGRLCARYPQRAVMNSQNAYAALQSHQTVFRPQRVRVIPNAVDTQAFQPDTPYDANHKEEPIQLLCVGSLSAPKRWTWLLPILKTLSDRHALPQWRVVICGEGEERQEIERQLTVYRLQDRVRLVGYQPDVAGWMKKSHILLLCSAFEGTPNVVAEALSCGVPVVTTDVGDVQTLVRHGQDGYVVGVDEADSFADRLCELLRSPQLRRQMGLSGREWMCQTRSPQVLIEKTLQTYREFGWNLPC